MIRRVVVIETTNMDEGVEGWELPCDLNLVSVVWGMQEVTEDAAKKYEAGQKNFVASVEEWGDGWPGYKKTLDVVYEACGNFASVSAREGESIILP